MTQNYFFGCENSKFRRSSDVNRFILDILCRLLLLLSKRLWRSKDEIQLRKLHSHLWNCSIHQWWVDLIYRLRRSVTKIWKFKVCRPKKFDRWGFLYDYVTKLATKFAKFCDENITKSHQSVLRDSMMLATINCLSKLLFWCV